MKNAKIKIVTIFLINMAIAFLMNSFVYADEILGEPLLLESDIPKFIGYYLSILAIIAIIVGVSIFVIMKIAKDKKSKNDKKEEQE